MFRSFIRVATLAGVMTTVSLTACRDANSPLTKHDVRRELGILQLIPVGISLTGAEGDGSTVHWNSPPGGGIVTAPRVIDAPDTVSAGSPVSVSVHTVLPNGCWSTDGQDVVHSGAVVEVTPQDQRSDAPACTLIYGWGSHPFTVTFATRGIAIIRVKGRRVRQADDVSIDSVTAEKTIVVR